MGHLFTFVFVYFSEVVFWVGDSGLRHGIKFFWADELLMRQFCGGFTFKTLGHVIEYNLFLASVFVVSLQMSQKCRGLHYVPLPFESLAFRSGVLLVCRNASDVRVLMHSKGL